MIPFERVNKFCGRRSLLQRPRNDHKCSFETSSPNDHRFIWNRFSLSRWSLQQSSVKIHGVAFEWLNEDTKRLTQRQHSDLRVTEKTTKPVRKPINDLLESTWLRYTSYLGEKVYSWPQILNKRQNILLGIILQKVNCIVGTFRK